MPDDHNPQPSPTNAGLVRVQALSRNTPVLVDGEPLDPAASRKVYNHSPDGFAWGYNGSGPAQLALAILMRHTDADQPYNSTNNSNGTSSPNGSSPGH
jgi:hypothetical protein